MVPEAFQMVIKFFKLTRKRFSIYRPSSLIDWLQKSLYAFFNSSISHFCYRSFIVLFSSFFALKTTLMLLLLVKVMW